MYAFDKLIKSIVFAHRGLHNEQYDENSLSAFENAINNGFAIELDVHVTRDEQIVVIHDATLTRVTGKDGIVEELTYAELMNYSLLKSGERIPLLSEVLTLIDGRVPLLVEAKAENSIPPTLVPAILKVIASYPYQETLLLQSFNPFVVKALKKGRSDLPVGQLMSDNLPGQSKFTNFLYRSLLVLKLSKPDFFNYEVSYIAKKRIQRKRKKLPLLTWTINNGDKLSVARAFADNFIFENLKP